MECQKKREKEGGGNSLVSRDLTCTKSFLSREKMDEMRFLIKVEFEN